MSTLWRMRVEAYNPDDDDWDDMGSVLLPMHASSAELHHALAAVEVFAPRGLDYVLWAHGDFAAMVFDA